MLPFFNAKYPFIALLLPIIGGILWVHQQLPIPTLLITGGFFLGCLFLLVGSLKRMPFPLFGFGLFCFLFTTSLYRSIPRLPDFQPGSVYQFEGECSELLSDRSCIIRTKDYNLYLQSWDSILPYKAGERYRLQTKILPLTSTANSHEFDFNAYLATQGIHARINPIKPGTPLGASSSIYSRCQVIRQYLLNKTERVIQDTLTRSLIQSLCLGYRQTINPKTKNLFQQTGTIHLLAISGLHMGAIYLLLSFVLRLLGLHSHKSGIPLIPLIWLFTAITGLSPSACRAASILTFIAIGKMLNRRYNTLNAIGASAFFTLLLQPGLLFSVSFQMSYAAYTGIVTLYPLLHPPKKKKKSRLESIYALLCVSLAAQIATLPISAYYFHYINLNSLLVNLIAVPLGTLLLYAGILLLFLPASIGVFLSLPTIGIAHLLLLLLQGFHHLAILQHNLYPTVIQLLLIYGSILGVTAYWKSRKHPFLLLTCGMLLCLLIYTGIHRYHQQNQQEVVVFNRYRKSSILLNYKGYYTFLKNNYPYQTPPPYTAANNLDSLPTSHAFLSTDIHFQANRLITPDQILYIADRIHRTPGKTDLLLITDNLHPQQIASLDTVRPSLLLLDASNSNTTLHAWKQWSRQKHIPCQTTREQGSIIIKLHTPTPQKYSFLLWD